MAVAGYCLPAAVFFTHRPSGYSMAPLPNVDVGASAAVATLSIVVAAVGVF
jgi:hypothetical protein